MPQAPLLGPGSSDNTKRDDLKAHSSSDSATFLPEERLSEDAEDRAIGAEEKGKRSESANQVPVDGQGEGEDDVIWVDWDGPDDPENPKKYAHLIACE